METINCSSWEECEEKILAISKQYEDRKKNQSWSSNLLFRGQESAGWQLETTLERFGKPNFKMEDYHHIIESLIPAVTSLTHQNWESENFHPNNITPSVPPNYPFMVYLRHHGFPSPLLDWTRSPYVAAFFAFRSKLKPSDEKATIFAFIEMPEGEKDDSGNGGSIVGLGPNIVTDPRHDTQQAEYTICKKRVQKNHFVYCPHEEAFTQNTKSQDQLTKFILPKSERTKVLEKLNLMNVNAYSLFGNEKGLMETLAYKEIEKEYP
ncbi:MAG: FRG domain-containing protein [Nitrospira sp.]|nr:FRG domain-containing protein [Nitrospira sp.]